MDKEFELLTEKELDAPNVAAHHEPDLPAIQWSRWLGQPFSFTILS